MINRVIMETRKIIHNESLCAFFTWSKSNILSPITPMHGWNRMHSYTYCILSTLKDRIHVSHAMELLHSTYSFSGTTTPAEGGERTENQPFPCSVTKPVQLGEEILLLLSEEKKCRCLKFIKKLLLLFGKKQWAVLALQYSGSFSIFHAS